MPNCNRIVFISVCLAFGHAAHIFAIAQGSKVEWANGQPVS